MPDKIHAEQTPVLLSSSPHIASPVNSKMLMGTMLIALAPSAIFGIYLFGVPALLNIIVSVAAAVIGETLFRIIIRQPARPGDLSAAVSGLLLALVIPPAVPLWMTALGAVFATVVAKEFFGGLGANVFNPALTGRAFLLMSFPVAMTTWRVPVHSPAGSLPTNTVGACFFGSGADIVSGATPLGIIAGNGSVADVGRSLAASGLTAPIGSLSPESYWPMIKSLFFGYRGGSTGETSILIILCAFVFLLITRVIDWRAPVSMVAAGFITAWALGLDPLFQILSGGLIFGAVFMATDYTTAPVTAKGKIIFGLGAGAISILIRKWGIYPEGVCFAILIMNAATPFLNRLLPRKYGYVKKHGGAGKYEAGK